MPTQIPRVSRLLGAPPDQANDTHVQALVAAKAPEDADLDYKQANNYIADNDGADELAKDVTGMANSVGGLIIIGIEEDDQACPKAPTPVAVSDDITGRMWQRLRARVVPWLDGIGIHPVSLPGDPGTGYYLIAVPRSPLAPHAVRTGGPNKPRYAYAQRVGSHTRWLEETEIANAYRSRFRLAEDHTTRALALFDQNPTPKAEQVGAEAVWIELALVPAVPADHRLDMTFISTAAAFLRDWATTAPAASLASSHQFTIARRRLRFDSGQNYLDLRTDGTAFVRALISVWRPIMGGDPPPISMWAAYLEYGTLGALHLAAKYARWAGAYGDADILARTSGMPTVALEQGGANPGTRVQSIVTRTSTTPTQITAPLDAITDDPRQLALTAHSIAADLLADYGQPRTHLLNDDGTITRHMLNDGDTFKTWAANSGILK